MPASQKQYPIRPEASKEIMILINELERQGVLVAITPIQAVPKPDGSYRLVHNVKALNDVTIKDKRVIIEAKTIMENYGPGGWFMTLDLSNGFWSYPITHKSQHA